MDGLEHMEQGALAPAPHQTPPNVNVTSAPPGGPGGKNPQGSGSISPSSNLEREGKSRKDSSGIPCLGHQDAMNLS